MLDMIVIGGGPAAMGAAFFAQGKDLEAVMLFDELGGKVGWRETLVGPDRDAYLPSNEVVQLLSRRIMNHAHRVIHEHATRVTACEAGFRVETQDHGTLEARTLIIATGAAPIPLNVPGARGFVGHGLEYSAATYAHLVKGARVAVIGGTVRALNSAAELVHVAERVYVIAPTVSRHGSELAAVLRSHPRVELLEGYTVAEVVGDDHLTGLVITHAGQTKHIDVEHAFVSLGLRPRSNIVRDIVDIDPGGFILVNEHYQTTVPGLYAAGDVTTRFGEQVLAAVGDGARAAMYAYYRLVAQQLVADSAVAQPA